MSEAGKKFEEILKQLEAEEQKKEDIVLPINDLRMNNDGKLYLGNERELKLNEHSLGQFCREFRMPKGYMKMWLDQKPDYAAMQFNYFLNQQNDTKKKFRLLGDEVRGIVSEKYAEIDDYRVLSSLNNTEISRQFPDMEIEKFYRNEKYMNMRILFPELERNVGVAEESGKEDIIKVGLSISNSEVGYSSLIIQPRTYRLVCSNGMMAWVEHGRMKKRHIHFDPSELDGNIRNGIQTAINEGGTLAKFMEDAREERVDLPYKRLEELGKKAELSKKQISELKTCYEFEPQDNLFGIINAFTRLGRHVEEKNNNNELRMKLEQFAGNLLQQA